MTLIVCCLSKTVFCTSSWVVALGLAEGMRTVAHVGISALSIPGSIDCTFKLDSSGEASNFRWRGDLVVGIGASNNNLEAVPPLSFVLSLYGRDGCTPESAFEVSKTGGVGAIGPVRVETRITLDIQVECLTA